MASEEIQRHFGFWLLEKHDDRASASRYAAAFFPDDEIRTGETAFVSADDAMARLPVNRTVT